MDRRTLLALVLTAIVIVATPLIFPASRRARQAADTTRAVVDSPATPPAVVAPTPPARDSQRPAPTAAPASRAETTLVRTPHVAHRIVSPGGVPSEVTLPDYRSLRPAAASGTPVNLLEPGDRLFRLAVATARDTITLDTVPFTAAPQRMEGNTIVQVFTSALASLPLTLTYRVPTDSFVMRVDGVFGASAGQAPRALLVTLPRRIRSEEANLQDDTRHLAFAYRTGPSEVTSVSFRDLEPNAMRADTGSFRWVAARNKYFVVGVQPLGRDSAFRGVVMRGGTRVNDAATSALATAVLPLSGDQTFSLRVFAGPQSWNHLRAAAPDFENVNPVGGFAHGLVQPFATIVMRLLLWIRETFQVGYGWVLVIFGVAVRLLLWPLNQSAMRSSMRLQRIQPQLAELQKKYRDNPERQREAMMKLYQEHGMSPFTPILGCLPMLLPMPILFALYFVFQNTIEFRGVPFFWLPDLSLKDPLFITPLFMGVSMFVLSWIGMRGMPPNPQSKMMSYVMPVMFTVLFWNFASGLNLYYAVQNVAALPQQWLLSRERAVSQATGTSKPPGDKAKAVVRKA